MPDPSSKSTDLERVRKGLRSNDTRQFMRALEAVLREALRCQQVNSREAGKVAKVAVEESHRAALADDRWMIRL